MRLWIGAGIISVVIGGILFLRIQPCNAREDDRLEIGKAIEVHGSIRAKDVYGKK